MKTLWIIVLPSMLTFDPAKPELCPLMLVQGTPGNELDAPGPRWAKVADVGRPGDRAERHRLYRLNR